MSENTQTKTEIELLREQLDERGILYKANATKSTLEKLLQKADEAEELEDENTKLKKLQDEALKLVHVIISPNDPLKQQMTQEYFGTGNLVLGTIARVIPFGENWLVEQALLNTIKEKQYQMHIVKRNAKGEEYTESKLVPAYQITELPLPTKAEIEELARTQQARATVE
ncbi:hypothetical protein [Moraxella nonliquefaciens]|jgi:hypothetical protein|uniref:Uncharacterized protein n=1 Tax=Moraxella nonliquefaciens TaxID=478 RepID=A0A1B8QTB0_MORNO|nr:hypothetical protein [Moraxella nonliquefaciens]OBX88378.1 hypothetical protein A7456_00505 [Moraxella nonliquefaciens]QPT44564.1 hypothetical protein I6G26_11135 [Moraxella nonliquefaciens]QQC29584.1 hypothetical protein I6H63_09915 [Moraxella nonliquefaciens]